MLKFLATLTALLVALPANASTIPVLDPGPQGLTLAVGLVDANVDVRLNDRWQVGLTGIANLVQAVAVRATYRQEDWLGLVLSAGLDKENTAGMRLLPDAPPPNHAGVWFQPALLLTAALPGTPATVRLTLGPVVRSNVLDVPTWTWTAWNPTGWMLPNAELGVQLGGGELTLGGNSLLGWRARW